MNTSASNTSASAPVRYWQDLSAAVAHLQPLVLLLFRLVVALAFWRAGVVKLADPSGTLALFSNTYQVPLLAPQVAATLGTWVELITPWFLIFGLGPRAVAAMLFVYNVIAVVSYPDLWPDGFWTGLIGTDFNDHKAWGLMLLATVAWGPGALSLDRLVCRWLNRRGLRGA